MKVICIDDTDKGNGQPAIKEGVIYDVEGETVSNTNERMYYLIGIYEYNPDGRRYGYAVSRFIPLSSIDETEFERNYKKEPAWIEAYNKL